MGCTVVTAPLETSASTSFANKFPASIEEPLDAEVVIFSAFPDIPIELPLLELHYIVSNSVFRFIDAALELSNSILSP